MKTNELTSDLQVAEAGRLMMAQQFAMILHHEQQVHADADLTAVHEMRKAIRRTFTSFKLFESYFKPGTIKPYRRGLRRIMRRLGRSRDLAVLRFKLDIYNESVDQPLDDLASYWQLQQRIADDTLMKYLDKPNQQAFLVKYREFIETSGLGNLPTVDPWVSVKIGHIAPVLIYQRVAAVQSYGAFLQNATAKHLHRLRIQFKELRYTLQFFAPLLGAETQVLLVSLKQSQEHLGDLNDATVALRLLDDAIGLETSIAQYQTYQQNEVERLVRTYSPVWQGFYGRDWRRNLADAIASLY